ncbi:MAG: four helix bundle protein [Lewinellaceae bacterium]|nr:four helix bundle protein [Phaeodactylibacter sp.]MCB9041568.1 four helix bundle protein [Lewinellaceae bacterium]
MEKKKKYDLEERLIRFSVMVLNLVDQLPKTYAGKHLEGQLVRSGTSPALNYGEAQAAESNKDFIHKMKVCLKELRETQICLKIIKAKPLLPEEDVEPVLKEVGELVAIFTTSVQTATGNR